ncbi:MAG: hypothetical protein PVH64_03210 [Bacillota bacterium]|jgi:hypothetical protein
MNKIIFRSKIALLLILSLWCLLISPTLAGAASINSLIASNDTSYLGVSFNSLTRNFIPDNTCLTFRNIGVESADRINASSYYCFVDSRRALEDKFMYNFTSVVGVTVGSTALSKVTAAIVNDTVFSTDKITLIAYWKQEEKKLFSADLPVMSNEALAVLKDNSRAFFKTYGDKYVSGVSIGKILYLVYQADIANLSSYSARTKKPLKEAMELNLKKILGAKLTVAETDFMTTQLAKVTTHIYTYGNNVDPFVGPYTADDFQDVVKKISNEGTSGVISRELRDYSAIINRSNNYFRNIADHRAMSKIWNAHLTNLQFILANPRISFNLSSDCRTKIREVNAHLDLVNSLAGEARLPNSKEQEALETLYKKYIVEMQIMPRTYYLPIIKGTTKIDLRQINDVDTIKIIYYHPPKNLIWYLFLRKTHVGLLMLDQNGNWSMVNSRPIGESKTITLYEGIKFCDQLQLTFSNTRINTKKIKVLVSFTEKIDDVIWVYLRSQLKK